MLFRVVGIDHYDDVLVTVTMMFADVEPQHVRDCPVVPSHLAASLEAVSICVNIINPHYLIHPLQNLFWRKQGSIILYQSQSYSIF